MNHRISAGGFVIQNDKILLVNHRKVNHYDFWVPPGGGVIGTEDIHSAAVREVKEESGLQVDSMKLVYIEEFYKPRVRECKFWFYTNVFNGSLETEEASAKRENIVDVQFVSRSELNDLVVFPSIIKTQLWEDIKIGFPKPQYLGIHEMEFY